MKFSVKVIKRTKHICEKLEDEKAVQLSSDDDKKGRIVPTQLKPPGNQPFLQVNLLAKDAILD